MWAGFEEGPAGHLVKDPGPACSLPQTPEPLRVRARCPRVQSPPGASLLDAGPGPPGGGRSAGDPFAVSLRHTSGSVLQVPNRGTHICKHTIIAPARTQTAHMGMCLPFNLEHLGAAAGAPLVAQRREHLGAATKIPTARTAGPWVAPWVDPCAMVMKAAVVVSEVAMVEVAMVGLVAMAAAERVPVG